MRSPATASSAAAPRACSIGPSHHADFKARHFQNAKHSRPPLGAVAVDTDVCARLRHDPDIIRSDAAHQHEHCLEVQLPFLQVVLGAFTLVPLLTGRASTADVARVLEAAWGDVGTIVVVSSDLSHYLAYAAARSLDAGTAASIAARAELRDPSRACGALAINGLLARARALDLAIEELARLNSGDTAGDRARVVGYGAWCLHAA
ncbi:MAG: AmmeMemoRadiSam system protein B [Steroidobacteraceae bacterium]